MVKLFGISVVAIVLAIFSAAISMVNATSNLNSTAAIFIGIADGFALEKQSSILFQQAVLENGGIFPEKFQSDVDELAMRAFAKEPLVPSAIAMMAINRQQRGGGQSARELMLLNAQLSKRVIVTQYWLANDYSHQGNLEDAMEQYDIILRTHKSARKVLVPIMAKSLENSEFVDPIADVVSKGAPWVFDFWNEVSRHPGSLENAALLKVRLLDNDNTTVQPSDGRLVRALIQNQKFDAAANYYTAMQRGATDHQKPNLLATKFSKEPGLGPLDWDIISEGDFGASVDGKENVLFISALPGSKGIVARKLIKLPDGTYQATIKMGQSERLAEGELEMIIRCAEKASVSLSEIVLPITKSETVSLIQPASFCQYYWMELAVESAENGNGVDMIVKEIWIDSSGS